MLEDKLKQLLAFARHTDLQEVAWEKDGAKITFRRTEARAQALRAKLAAAASPEAELPAEPAVMHIRSTMVGTFFRGDSNDRPPLVVEGTMVAQGQTVASIEAMKIRKDVVAPSNCRIVRPLVADGHSVEYGQPLFEVEPEEAANEYV